jgi:hypothetical protein
MNNLSAFEENIEIALIQSWRLFQSISDLIEQLQLHMALTVLYFSEKYLFCNKMVHVFEIIQFSSLSWKFSLNNDEMHALSF